MIFGMGRGNLCKKALSERGALVRRRSLTNSELIASAQLAGETKHQRIKEIQNPSGQRFH
jgi:hypothetical protein